MRKIILAASYLGLAASSAHAAGTLSAPNLGAGTAINGSSVLNMINGRLNKAGDTMGPGALLGITLGGAPTFANLQDMLRDIGAFYSFGGVADGGSHPLSSVTSFGGANTTGYTLAQWRLVFSGTVDPAGNNPVTALSNETDEVAIQALVNTRLNYATGQETVTLPSGLMRETHPIKSGCQMLTVKGAGEFSTQIVQTVAGQDGWHHGTSDTACPAAYGARFAISDLTLSATSYGGTALAVTQNAGTSGFRMRNFYVRGGYPDYFFNGVICSGCSDMQAYNVTILGALSGIPAMAGVGLSLGGNSNDGYNWVGGLIGGFNQCVVTYTGGPPGAGNNGDVEGMNFSGMNTGDCGDVFTTIYDGVPPPQTPEFQITNSQFGTTHNHFLLMNGSADVWVKNNLLYTTTPFIVGGSTFTGGSTTATIASGAVPVAGDYVVTPFNVLPANDYIVSVNAGANTYQLAAAALGSVTNQTTTYEPVGAFTGNTLSGSATVSNISAWAYTTEIGGTVVGPGIPANDTVVSISPAADTATLALPATATQTNAALGWRAHAATYYMSFNNMSDLFIRDNVFESGPTANIIGEMSIGNSYNVRVSGNMFDDLGNLITAAFYDQGGNKNLIESDDTFGPFWGAGGAIIMNTPFASNTQTVRWGSYYKGLGCDLGTSGKVTCSGSFVGTLSASTDLTVPLPAAFLAAPLVLAANGNYGVTTASCGPKGAGATTSFLAGCSSGTTGSNVQINYIATGF